MVNKWPPTSSTCKQKKHNFKSYFLRILASAANIPTGSGKSLCFFGCNGKPPARLADYWPARRRLIRQVCCRNRTDVRLNFGRDISRNGNPVRNDCRCCASSGECAIWLSWWLSPCPVCLRFDRLHVRMRGRRDHRIGHVPVERRDDVATRHTCGGVSGPHPVQRRQPE